jgi:hypothetical protein
MSRRTHRRGAALVLLASAALVLISSFSAGARQSGPIGPAAGAVAAAGDAVIAAAGDIACDPDQSQYKGGNGTASACRQLATSNLIASDPSISAVLALGDNQNDCGGYAAYLQAFGSSWGRFKSIVHPIPGNHEYFTSGGTDCAGGAAGYFRYFGAAAGDSRGDYAWNLGSWHLIALNGQCSAVGGCGSGSAQATFLQANLGSSTCTLAYWHQPYFSGTTTPSSAYRFFWQTLYNAGADVVIDGHIHTYGRFALQDPSGTVDTARGIRQFIVGTGGDSHMVLKGSHNVQYTLNQTFGVLKLTLHPTSYDWRFVTIAGATADSGTQQCH